MTDHEILSKELLNYLSQVPKNLQTHKAGYLGYFALDLGKCLVWISGRLQPRTPQEYTPNGETAKTVWSLGEQFKKIGLKFIDEQTKVELSLIETLKNDLDEMHKRLLKLESSKPRKGGRK